ncbi:hypothetical protein Ocin01_02974 [Orchesella cincta]|uniref:Uncharacterized protein n=1 Tax=Orchesella cincta TaxID=48709 RepID=A0A1D2NEJ5_ORCCI|nr:hypothetical protein Ocin01_02974 [Orchesella cincta]
MYGPVGRCQSWSQAQRERKGSTASKHIVCVLLLYPEVDVDKVLRIGTNVHLKLLSSKKYDSHSSRLPKVDKYT